MVAFVSMHSNSAQHFTVFSNALQERGIPTFIVFGGVAKAQLSGRSLDVDLDKYLEAKNVEEVDMSAITGEIFRTCSAAQTIFVGLGDLFSSYFIKALGESKRVVLYYDNPEVEVPGGYSTLVQVATSYARGKEIVFANKKLALDPLERYHGLEDMTKIGLGYYPMHDVEMLKKMRTERVRGEGRVIVFLGAATNDSVYGSGVIPEFINSLMKMAFEDMPVTLIFRKHPRSNGLDWMALSEIEKDGLTIVLDKEPFVLTTLAKADMTCYWQTSLAPLVALGRANPVQVGCEDVSGIMLDRLISPQEEVDEAAICHEIGFDPAWKESLVSIVLPADSIVLTAERVE